jgi:hypothetical protein
MTNEEDPGFVWTLFDLSFTSFATPRLVKVIYIVQLIAIGVGTVAWDGLLIFGSTNLYTKTQDVPWLQVGLFAASIPVTCIEVLLARIFCEFVVVAFRMAEDLRAMRGTR